MSVTVEQETSGDPDAALANWNADRVGIEPDWDKAANEVAPSYENVTAQMVDALAGIDQTASDQALVPTEAPPSDPQEPLVHRIRMQMSSVYRENFYLRQLLVYISQRENYLRAIGRPNNFHMAAPPRLKIAVVNIKGGVAKTTTTIYLGSLLSELTRRRTVVLDVNNEGNGDAAERLGIAPLSTPMLWEAYQNREAIFSNYGTSVDRMPMTRHGVSVITVDDVPDEMMLTDPEALNMLSDKEHYDELIRLAHDNCGFLMLDTSNSLNGDANKAALEAADVIIFVADATQGSSLARLHKSMVRYAAMSPELHDKVNSRSVIALKGASAGRIPAFKLLIRYSGPCVAIPIDPVIARDEPVDLKTIHPITYSGFLDLAINCLGIANGEGAPLADPATWGPPAQSAPNTVDAKASTDDDHPPFKEE